MAREIERVGIVFVHGIGEQRRFEHLDAEVRPLIAALLRRKSNHTVEITGGGDAPLRADQDTWASQPVRVVVHEDDECEKQIFFHEVWWADVNEPYSIMKELRFWWWGLSIWNFPDRALSLPGQHAMASPQFPEKFGNQDRIARRRLFQACNVFLMGGFTLGLWTFLARRLLNFGTFKPVRIFVNYVSAVKLYVQGQRSDGGFLDAYGEPPRVSIRRRMVRTLVDVAQAKYDRWYIFAHSLGSVVAYNGIMENAQALPNYLDEKRWRELLSAKPKLGGPGRKDAKTKAPIDIVAPVEELKNSFPRRPLWLSSNAVVYRDRLFRGFRGIVTYGSPLDKFAAIWPQRVPINVRERAFSTDVEWINVYDPTDPVAAHLDAFSPHDAELKPRNIGYSAYWVLLLSHLRYLSGCPGRTDRLADRLIEWVLGGKPFSLPPSPSRWLWYEPGSLTEWIRRSGAKVSALIVYLVLSFSGTLFIWFVFLRNTESKDAKWIDGIFTFVGTLAGSEIAAGLKSFVSEQIPAAWTVVARFCQPIYGEIASWPWIGPIVGALVWIVNWFLGLLGFLLALIWKLLSVAAESVQGFARQNMNLDGAAWTLIWNTFVLMIAVALIVRIAGSIAGIYWRHQQRHDNKEQALLGGLRVTRKAVPYLQKLALWPLRRLRTKMP